VLSATGCRGCLPGGETGAKFPDQNQSGVQRQSEVNGAQHQYAYGLFGSHGMPQELFPKAAEGMAQILGISPDRREVFGGEAAKVAASLEKCG